MSIKVLGVLFIFSTTYCLKSMNFIINDIVMFIEIHLQSVTKYLCADFWTEKEGRGIAFLPGKKCNARKVMSMSVFVMYRVTIL